ncbi:hypothetical protein GGI19_004261 [Coemansia pectinata]|uniref:Uncharacterized protein n=1 Tax=Coemansia pectinata TaxID=1052879 RepID=A0A9W8GSX8_9FUNG|nr:hypothetical protein GGI19_004261 [Coemansia pectinata]
MSFFTSSAPSSDTLVATEMDTFDFTLTLAHTNVYSFGNLVEDMFKDMFPVVAGNNKACTDDDIAEDFGAEVADDYYEVVNSEHAKFVEADADARVIATSNRYSILSIVYRDFNCYSIISLEFSMDGDSSHALGLDDDLKGKNSDMVTERMADNCGVTESMADNCSVAESITDNGSVSKSIAGYCSVTSTDPVQSEALAIADESKSFFNGLSERDRSTLRVALCVVLEESAGKAVPRVEYIKVYCVVRMALRFRARGEMNITPELLFMAAGINMMGVDDALGWLYPVIEDFCRTHLYDKGISCEFA